jgi:hypothetical protein
MTPLLPPPRSGSRTGGTAEELLLARDDVAALGLDVAVDVGAGVETTPLDDDDVDFALVVPFGDVNDAARRSSL